MVEDKIILQSMLLIRAPSCVAARTWRGIIALGVCRKRAKRGEGPAGAEPLRGVLNPKVSKNINLSTMHLSFKRSFLNRF